MSIILLALLLTQGDPAGARAEVERLIKASGAETVAVAAYDTQTGRSLLVNERASLHAASTMKVPVMMEIFRLAEEGKLAFGESVEVRNRFRSIVDGSEYSLSREDDSDDEVYLRVGRGMTILELIDHMITRSSNLAANILIERAGAEQVTALMRRLGAADIQVRRGVEDTKAFRAGLNNTTTAYDLMVILRALAEQNFLRAGAREQMIRILAAQHFNDGIPAGLPAGTRVAHKTGWITGISHDAAIIFTPARKPYVLVVLTRGIRDKERASRLIADISRAVYQALAPGT